MADVAHGQRVVAGHDQVAGEREHDGQNDLVPRQMMEVVDDVAIAIARQRVLQDPQRYGKQNEDERRFEKRREASQALGQRTDSMAIHSGTPWAALCLAASMSWTYVCTSRS